MEWKIKPHAECCCKTGRPFVEGEIFYTLLKFEKGEPVRYDLCTEAWNQEIQSGEPGASFWRCVFKPDPPEQKDPLPKKDAEAQLRSLLDQTQPLDSSKARLASLLALLLERRKILRLKARETEGDQPLLIYERAETHEAFIVPDVELKLDEAEALWADLQAAN